MKKHVTNLLRSLVFLSILAFSLFVINRVLRPKYTLENSDWPTTSTYEQFYEMKENSIDVIFLGSSVMVNAVSPQEIYNTSGIRSYNLGSEQQSVFLSYYWLKEALRFQSPKVVVLDTRFVFELHPENPINTRETLQRKCLDPMRWSEVKREAVRDVCRIDTTQSEMSYYLTNIRYHGRWTELSEQDFIPEEYTAGELKGFSPLEEYGDDSYAAYVPGGGKDARDLQPVMREYLDKTVDLCREKGITLILLSLPGNAMSDRENNALTSYAESRGVDYYNFCEKTLYDALGAELPREKAVSHANLWGAIRVSDYLGALLREKYKVQSLQDAQYEETKDYYAQVIKDCELAHIKDFNQYLKELKDDRYTVFIASLKDTSTCLTEEMKENLAALGIKTDLTEKKQWSYAAVIDAETGVTEIYDEKLPAVLSGSVRGKKTFYELTGTGYYAGTGNSLVIDGKEYSKNKTGLTFVVYDNVRRKVIDRATFNTSTEKVSVSR